MIMGCAFGPKDGEDAHNIGANPAPTCTRWNLTAPHSETGTLSVSAGASWDWAVVVDVESDEMLLEVDSGTLRASVTAFRSEAEFGHTSVQTNIRDTMFPTIEPGIRIITSY
jgi:hypothetical protein